METRPKETKSTPRKGKQKFSFESPPEAPVFKPTLEEFENPLEYIKKIRIIGEKTGICKIIPPEGWKSPFVLARDKVKFTPRIQRINELEARTRIKLNFIDQLTKFFALRGKTFQMPVVEKKSLDLYTLHRLVKEKGGLDEVSKEKKWSDIATEMGYISKTAYSILKHNYEDLILPFLQSQKESDETKAMNCNRTSDKNSVGRLLIKSLTEDNPENGLDAALSKYHPALRELKSLQFLGPGPKMAVCEEIKENSRTRGKKIMYEFDPLAKYMCKSCCTGDIEESLVLCVTCQDRYHSSCLIPRMVEVPERWRCPKCVAAEAYKPLEDFGFAQAEKEYTLLEFEEMANKFKRNYFKVEPSAVQSTKLEQEFWRVVSSIDEAVTVEYGADLHVIDHGSGFPRRNFPYVDGIENTEYDKYADSPWNLNNLPVLNTSVLRHISADISGMKIPWMYAGMCFATFCWHNEDHWSYSINYLHLGEPKTWYGVSGSNAEKFEKAMKSAAPELFAAQPDLLHHLVTIMNPNDLMYAGVPVFRTDQKEGEFVITFPRAYHAGFNQGFNFAEACNFAPYDWLQMGRECISHYSSLKRPCVFSHDELVCNMALIADDLDRDIAEATMKDMIAMVNAETTKWNRAVSFGITTVIDFNYETLPDDERVCSECNTTVYLSAVFCPCNRSKLVCLEHIHKLCECKPTSYIVKCQFRINFLREIVEILKSKLFRFGEWKKRVENALSPKSENKISLRALTELLIEAKEKDFPQSDLVDLLEFQVRKCIDCSALARVIVGNALSKKNVENRLTVDDIVMFYEEIKNLPCTITEAGALKKILQEALKFQRMAATILKKKAAPRARISDCVQLGKELDLDLIELPLLEKRLAEFDWVENAEALISKGNSSIYETEQLLNACPASTTRKVALKKEDLTKYLTNLKNKQDNDECIAVPNSDSDLAEIKSILSTSEQFHLKLPNKEILEVKVNKIQMLENTIKKVLKGEEICYVAELQALLEKGKALCISSDYLRELEESIFHANTWLNLGKKMFIRRNSNIVLMQALWPRRYENRATHFQRSLLKNYNNIECLITDKDHNFTISDFKYAFDEQYQTLCQLRLENLEISAQSDSALRRRCVCGEELVGYSIVCTLCRTSFHVRCFEIDMSVLNAQVPGFSTKNLCSYCTLTKRPSIENINTLYVSSNQLVVKVPECIALSFTYKKLKKWQKRAQQLLTTKQLSEGLNSILKSNENVSAMTRDSWKSFKFNLRKEIFQSSSDNNSPTHCINLQSNIKFDGDLFAELRLTLLFGDMFEASSMEMEHLWILFDAWQTRFQFPKTNPSNSPSEKPLVIPGMCDIPEANNLQRTEITKKIKFTKKPVKKLKVIKKKTTQKLPSQTPQTSPNTTITESIVELIPAAKPVKRKKRNYKTTKKNTSSQSDSNPPSGHEVWEEHEAGDPCAALNCQKPADLNVSWVQCDGQCGQWYHMKCVDLEQNNLGEEDEFKCHLCRAHMAQGELCPPFKKIKLPMAFI